VTETSVNPNEVLDEVGLVVYNKLVELSEKHNSNVQTIKAAKGDSQALLETLRESYTDNEEVNQLREAIEKLQMNLFRAEEKRDQLLKPVVAQMKEQASEGTEELEETNKELKTQIRAAQKFIKTIVTDDETLKALMPKLKSDTSGGGGTGTRRIQHRNWIVGDEEFCSASAAAAKLNVATADFQSAFFEAAGSDQKEKWPEEVTFKVGDSVVISQANPPAESESAPLSGDSAEERE
jgi:seryl-tRNA synthetase